MLTFGLPLSYHFVVSSYLQGIVRWEGFPTLKGHELTAA